MTSVRYRLEGAGVASCSPQSAVPCRFNGVAKSAGRKRRAPDIPAKHNEEILQQLGFDSGQIAGFRAKRSRPPEAQAHGGRDATR